MLPILSDVVSWDEIDYFDNPDDYWMLMEGFQNTCQAITQEEETEKPEVNTGFTIVQLW